MTARSEPSSLSGARLAAALAILSLALPAGAEDCSRPYPLQLPAEPPAAEASMLDLQRQVKSYLAEAEEYLSCNEAEQRVLAALAEQEDGDDDAEVQIKILLTRYNNTVDEMHVVGERFNALVKAWRETNEDPSS